jgi:putative phage-type endonuclease
MTESPSQGTPEWLQARMSGIGGSEISALYQLPDGRLANPWLSQVRMWGEKTGRISNASPAPLEQPQLYVGTMLEPVVREMFTTFSGRKVTDGVTLLRHAESPMIANTDGTLPNVEGKDGPGVYEGKSASAFNRSNWYEADGEPSIPLHIQLQVQHYLACTGLSWGCVCVFFGGDRQPISWFDIDRHQPIIDDMVERSARWWRDYVVADKQPPADTSKICESDLRALQPQDNGRFVMLPPGFSHVIARLDALDGMRGALTVERQRLRNMVISTMGGAAYAEIAGDGRGFTLRSEGTSRKFRTATHQRMDRARRDTGVSRPDAVYVPREVSEAIEAIERVSWQYSNSLK